MSEYELEKFNNTGLIIYTDGELELRVPFNNETVWLRQDEILSLFGKDRTVISRHINNILKDKEVLRKSNVQKMHFANSDKPVKLYSLDIILAVGYRTNSAKAIKFRQWSTNILRDYILNGYSINSNRITDKRFLHLENDVKILQEKVSKISEDIISKKQLPKQGIMFDKQVFDAYKYVSDIFKSADKSISIIDNYVDESVLMILSKRKKGVKAKIYTKKISAQLKLDVKKFNEQYDPVEVVEFENSHDRFIVIDEKVIYHFGASLKDLGKKWFGFSKMDVEAVEMLSRLSIIKLYRRCGYVGI